MRLRRSAVRGPGIAEWVDGCGFSYQNPDGTPFGDAAMLQRIKDLVIPPAWRKVWNPP
jgi:DNA topoisomerase-1